MSPLAFLGGMGQARQGAASQQAALDQNRMNTESAAWSGAIQQGFNALRPLALAPFVPQLSQLAQTNPAAAMMAGNLLGMPALTQYGQMQAGFGFDTQLQAQGIQGRKDIYEDEFNRNYQLAYGQTSQNMPMMGQSIYDSLPPSEQALMLSGTGYNPQTIGSAPPQIRQGIMRSIGEGQAMQRQSMEAAFANQRLQGIQENVAIGQDLMQNGGGYSITDPDWQKEFNNLRQGLAQTANDPNIAGQEPQRRMMGDGIRSMYDFVDRANRAGVIKRNVDPIQRDIANQQRYIDHAKKNKMKSVWVPGPDGKSHPITIDDDKIDTSEWTPEQRQQYIRENTYEDDSGTYLLQPGGKIEFKPPPKGAGDIDINKMIENASKPNDLTGVVPSADTITDTVVKQVEAVGEVKERIAGMEAQKNSPVGKFVRFLDGFTTPELDAAGLPHWHGEGFPQIEKERHALRILTAANLQAQQAQMLNQFQQAWKASEQAVGQKQQQILSKAAANPTMHNPQPGTPIPQGPELQMRNPLSIKELDDAPPGTRGQNKRGVWATKQPDGTWKPDGPIKSRKRGY